MHLLTLRIGWKNYKLRFKLCVNFLNWNKVSSSRQKSSWAIKNHPSWIKGCTVNFKVSTNKFYILIKIKQKETWLSGSSYVRLTQIAIKVS